MHSICTHVQCIRVYVPVSVTNQHGCCHSTHRSDVDDRKKTVFNLLSTKMRALAVDTVRFVHSSTKYETVFIILLSCFYLFSASMCTANEHPYFRRADDFGNSLERFKLSSIQCSSKKRFQKRQMNELNEMK